jgi:hypothetical protein
MWQRLAHDMQIERLKEAYIYEVKEPVLVGQVVAIVEHEATKNPKEGVSVLQWGIVANYRRTNGFVEELGEPVDLRNPLGLRDCCVAIATLGKTIVELHGTCDEGAWLVACGTNGTAKQESGTESEVMRLGRAWRVREGVAIIDVCPHDGVLLHPLEAENVEDETAEANSKMKVTDGDVLFGKREFELAAKVYKSAYNVRTSVSLRGVVKRKVSSCWFELGEFRKARKHVKISLQLVSTDAE